MAIGLKCNDQVTFKPLEVCSSIVYASLTDVTYCLRYLGC